MPPSSTLIALASAIASQHALDPALVCAIIEQESSWDTHAIRYEPAFRSRYVAPLGLPPTEEIARSISWGLMQVMGQSAREHSFAGRFLSALCDPLRESLNKSSDFSSDAGKVRRAGGGIRKS